MNEDVGAAGASALVTGHMSDRMSNRIAVVGGRRRWSVDQKLSILREAFGPDGSVSATCQRHAIGSGITVIPEQLHQITALPSKGEQRTGMRALLQNLLRHHSQAVKTLAHICCAAGQEYPR